MPVEMISVRHKTSGLKAFLPETALHLFPGYVKTPSQEAREAVPDGTAFPSADMTTGDTPSDSSPKAVWVDYAVSHLGLDRDEAEASTKQHLIDLTK